MQHDDSDGNPLYHLPRGQDPLTRERRAKGDIRRDGTQNISTAGADTLTKLHRAGILDDGHYHTGLHFQEMRSLATAHLKTKTGRLEQSGGSDTPLDSFDYFHVWHLLGEPYKPKVQRVCFSAIADHLIVGFYPMRGHYQEAMERLQQAIDDNRQLKSKRKKGEAPSQIYVAQLGKVCDIDCG